MKRKLLLLYQLGTGLSDTGTGVLLMVAPGFTLQLMLLHPAPAAMPYLSYIGAFVLSVGVACLYGLRLALRSATEKLETVWLLTAITRGLVAAFVLVKVASGVLEAGWLTVAFTDAVFALLQTIGLAKGWLRNVRA